MTEERRAQLEADRQHALFADQVRVAEKRLIDGVRCIEAAVSRSTSTSKPAAQAVGAGTSATKVVQRVGVGSASI
jgi:hypothetical protein